MPLSRTYGNANTQPSKTTRNAAQDTFHAHWQGRALEDSSKSRVLRDPHGTATTRGRLQTRADPCARFAAVRRTNSGNLQAPTGALRLRTGEKAVSARPNLTSVAAPYVTSEDLSKKGKVTNKQQHTSLRELEQPEANKGPSEVLRGPFQRKYCKQKKRLRTLHV